MKQLIRNMCIWLWRSEILSGFSYSTEAKKMFFFLIFAVCVRCCCFWFCLRLLLPFYVLCVSGARFRLVPATALLENSHSVHSLCFIITQAHTANYIRIFCIYMRSTHTWLVPFFSIRFFLGVAVFFLTCNLFISKVNFVFVWECGDECH